MNKLRINKLNLFVAFAGGLVLARIALAWVDGDVTAVAGVAGLAEAGVVADAGLVLAHGAVGAGARLAVGLLDLAVDAGVAFFALAPGGNRINSYKTRLYV
jgi:hypothetical protein